MPQSNTTKKPQSHGRAGHNRHVRAKAGQLNAHASDQSVCAVKQGRPSDQHVIAIKPPSEREQSVIKQFAFGDGKPGTTGGGGEHPQASHLDKAIPFGRLGEFDPARMRAHADGLIAAGMRAISMRAT